MTPERAPDVPGQGISWLSSASTSVKSLRLKSNRGNCRSITPTDNIGSGGVPAGRIRSVAARTAACRRATVGLLASASATSACRTGAPATGAESCAYAGPTLAITSALAARVSCGNCIPLLANQFPAKRAGARACGRRVRVHYVWERLGLGRRRERRLRVGRREGRNAEADNVGFSYGNGNASTQRNNSSRCGGAEG